MQKGKNVTARTMGLTITILARMLLLISSVTLISLLALSKCGISGALDNNDIDEGMYGLIN